MDFIETDQYYIINGIKFPKNKNKYNNIDNNKKNISNNNIVNYNLDNNDFNLDNYQIKNQNLDDYSNINYNYKTENQYNNYENNYNFNNIDYNYSKEITEKNNNYFSSSNENIKPEYQIFFENWDDTSKIIEKLKESNERYDLHIKNITNINNNNLEFGESKIYNNYTDNNSFNYLNSDNNNKYGFNYNYESNQNNINNNNFVNSNIKTNNFFSSKTHQVKRRTNSERGAFSNKTSFNPKSNINYLPSNINSNEQLHFPIKRTKSKPKNNFNQTSNNFNDINLDAILGEKNNYHILENKISNPTINKKTVEAAYQNTVDNIYSTNLETIKENSLEAITENSLKQINTNPLKESYMTPKKSNIKFSENNTNTNSGIKSNPLTTSSKKSKSPSVPLPPPQLPSNTYYFHLKGLYNIGSTCYMNSVLQCLLHTNELVSYFINEFPKDFPKLKENNKDVITNGNVSKAFYDLVKSVYPEKKPEKKSLNNSLNSFNISSSNILDSVSPEDFQQTIGNYNEQFQNLEANDSKNLILYLLQTIHAELNYFSKNKGIEGNPNQYDRANSFYFFINSYDMQNWSIISKVFYGTSENITECKNCHKILYIFQKFVFISF